MTQNPFLNALAAIGYISTLIVVLFYGPVVDGPADNTILIPIAMLSLLVFSAATMAYIFFYNPLLLFLEGKQKEGVTLFLSTMGIFGGVVIALLLAALALSRLAPAL